MACVVGMMPLEPCRFRQLLWCATGVCCPGVLRVDMCRLMSSSLIRTSTVFHIHSHVGAISTLGVATEGANYLVLRVLMTLGNVILSMCGL